MNLQQIYEEAAYLVPNSFTDVQRVAWVNDLNRSFFEIVKIPRVVPLNIVASQPTYPLTSAVTLRNIDKVVGGTTIYQSLQLEDVAPGNAGWTFDETTFILTLSPPPAYNTTGYVRHMQTATTTFVTASPATQTPDAPLAYHESYVYGLSERMALALDDIPRAQNYGQQYRAQLQIAQANYQRG